MKKSIMLGMTIGAMVMFSGCGVQGPQFQSFEKPKNQNNGMVYIYRKAQGAGDAIIYPAVVKSGNNVYYMGSMEINGYTNKEIKAGVATIYSKTSVLNKSKISFNIAKGKIICIKTYPVMGFFIGRPHFEIVDMQKCKKDIKTTKKILE